MTLTPNFIIVFIIVAKSIGSPDKLKLNRSIASDICF